MLKLSIVPHVFDVTGDSHFESISVQAAKGTDAATRAVGDMWDALYYLSIVLFLAVAMIGGAFLVRARMSGSSPMQAMGGLFGPKPERRLAISEQFNIDSRRRLVLIRRDDVEHLIMTGGPVDMLIEQGITAPRDHASGAAPVSTASAVSSRANLRP
jgi:flagellar protein FliO/FliZ